MDGVRVLAAIETVVARTRAKDPLRGENLALLAWPDGEEPATAEETLAVILSDIAARPESVTLADLAQRYSYSQSYLSELIHERCGRTFGELVREQRMERAAMLLRATSLPVAEVARRVGYAGTSNFYRAFREQYGCSPAELRTASHSGNRPSSGRAARSCAPGPPLPEKLIRPLDCVDSVFPVGNFARPAKGGLISGHSASRPRGRGGAPAPCPEQTRAQGPRNLT